MKGDIRRYIYEDMCLVTAFFKKYPTAESYVKAQCGKVYTNVYHQRVIAMDDSSDKNFYRFMQNKKDKYERGEIDG